MKKTKVIYYQQGDVLIEAVDSIPDQAKRTPAKERGFVLAEGEHTGHAHVIDRVANIEFVEKDGFHYIINSGPVTVTHEEHKPITIPPGTWRVRIVQEYDHFAEEARAVQD